MKHLFRSLFLISYAATMFSCITDHSYSNGGYINPNLFEPSFNTSVEQSVRFQEWHCVTPFGRHKEVLFANGDSIPVVFSGSQNMRFSSRLLLEKDILIPENSKKIDIELNYAIYPVLYPEKIRASAKQLSGTHTVKTDSMEIVPYMDSIATHRSCFQIDKTTNHIVIHIECNAPLLFVLQNCRILIDGEPLEKLVFNGKKQFSRTEKERFTAAIQEKEIPSDAKIIAIGESLHGVKEFEDYARDRIKNSILTDSCKLVLTEFPPLLGYALNDYVYQNLFIIQTIHCNIAA